MFPNTSKKTTNAIILRIALSSILFILALPALLSSVNTTVDFYTYYFAATVAKNGGNIYDGIALSRYESSTIGTVFPYLYPPLLAYMLIPLTSIPPVAAFKAWTVASVILAIALYNIACSVMAINKIETSPAKKANYFVCITGLIVFVLLAYKNNFTLGQVNIIVLFFITLSILFSEREKYFLSGVALGFAVLIKLSPLIILVYFIAIKKYKAVAWCLISIVATISVFAIAGEFHPWLLYFENMSGLSPSLVDQFLSTYHWLPVISLQSLFAYFFGKSTATANTLYYVAVFASIVFIFLYARKNCFRSLTRGISLTLVLVFMVIGSPVCWRHHVIYIFPGIFWTLCLISRLKEKKIRVFYSSTLVFLCLLAGMYHANITPYLADSYIVISVLRFMNLWALLLIATFSLIIAAKANMEGISDIISAPMPPSKQ